MSWDRSFRSSLVVWSSRILRNHFRIGRLGRWRYWPLHGYRFISFDFGRFLGSNLGWSNACLFRSSGRHRFFGRRRSRKRSQLSLRLRNNGADWASQSRAAWRQAFWMAWWLPSCLESLEWFFFLSRSSPRRTGWFCRRGWFLAFRWTSNLQRASQPIVLRLASLMST